MYVFVNINYTIRLIVMDILFTHLPGYALRNIHLFFQQIGFL